MKGTLTVSFHFGLRLKPGDQKAHLNSSGRKEAIQTVNELLLPMDKNVFRHSYAALLMDHLSKGWTGPMATAVTERERDTWQKV